MHLKLIYLLLAIALMASSCNTDTCDDIEPAAGVELSFNVSGVSRADNPAPFTRFFVYGDIRSLTSGASNAVILFNGTNVEYANGSWDYEGTQYWIPKREHSFVAVTPISVLGAANSPRYSDSQLSFDYTMPLGDDNLLTPGDVVDILGSTHRRYYDDNIATKAVEDKITFTFSHLMTKINFAPAFDDTSLAADAYILFHDMEFSGVDTKARFEILPAARLSNNQTNDMVIDITSAEKGKFVIKFTTPVKVENNATHVSLFTDNNAIRTLPQEFSAASDAKITFSYTISGEDTVRQVSIPLNNQKWLSGNSYAYRFTLERMQLKLDKCEINPWNIMEGDEISVD